MTTSCVGTRTRRSPSCASWRATARCSSWRSAPAGSDCHSPPQGCAWTGSSSRPRWPADCEPSLAATRFAVTIGDFADVGVPDIVPAGVRRVQHVLQPAHAGRPGALLRERRRVTSPTTAAFVIEAVVPGYLLLAARRPVRRCRGDRDRRGDGSTSAATTPSRSSSRRATSSCRPPGCELFPIVTRYAWPSEMDLMARIAGLRPRPPLGRLERRTLHRHHRPAISRVSPLRT